MIELDDISSNGAKIRVIGIGGGGGNAVNNMISGGLQGVDYIVANTDRQALENSLATIKIQVGKEATRGLGAGADPEVGKVALEESIEEVKAAVKGSDMVFIAAGMGGGTGTGGAPVVASVAQEMGALVVAIVTKPFQWENKKRMNVANNGLIELKKHVDAMIVIPNQKLLELIDKHTSIKDAFKKVDDVLFNATRGIADIISRPGYINVDFADVKTVMKGQGDALMGIGTAKGEDRAVVAAQNALNSPFLGDISIAGAQGLLVNITGDQSMTMFEVDEAMSLINDAVGDDANVISGWVYSDQPMEDLTVTIVATGFNNVENLSEKPAEAKKETAQTPDQRINLNKAPTELPFERRADANISYKPPIKISHEIPVQQIDRPAAAHVDNNEYYHMGKAPRGVENLKIFDQPAYKRREIENIARFEPSKDIYSNQNNNNNTANNNEYKAPVIDKPTFLRKIMD